MEKKSISFYANQSSRCEKQFMGEVFTIHQGTCMPLQDF